MVWQSCKNPASVAKKTKPNPSAHNEICTSNQQLNNTLRRELNVTVSQEEIIAGIAEIIEEVTGIEPSEITPEKSFVDDLDIDSLSMVEIAVQTEDKYGVKIPDEDLAGLRTVGDVVSYIQKLEEENPEAAQALRAKLETENPEAVESVRARMEADHQ
jgi:acyl carrier protein